MDHPFTARIKEILVAHFREQAEEIYERSPLLQYLNVKMRSANSGSKARSSFANVYALYVLIEDYVTKGYNTNGDYPAYEGANFSNLLRRQRELPFGGKLQNHGLNSRLNEEYKRLFPTSDYVPILRNSETRRYWINENLLKVRVLNQNYNLATSIVEIIDKYIEAKTNAFEAFIRTCEELRTIQNEHPDRRVSFIAGQLAPNVDARIFEIVSYSILKYHFHDQNVYFGFDLDTLKQENLRLYKTGRTNANDGGIDFVMKPLGRFFQVTETLDVKKYFLDIDKIEKYPITFVIKSVEDVSALRERLEQGAKRRFSIQVVVDRYMAAVEEIINIPALIKMLGEAIGQGHLSNILNEIIRQSRVEFNYEEDAWEPEGT